MHPAGFAIGVARNQLQIAAFARQHEDALVTGSILGGRRIARNQPRCSAARGYGIDALVLRKCRRSQVSSAALLEHDGIAVGRELRHCIVPLLAGDDTLAPSARIHGHDVAEPCIGPAHERNPLSVTRPCRPQLKAVGIA